MEIYILLTFIYYFLIIKNCDSLTQLEKIKLQKQLIQLEDNEHQCLRDCVVGEFKTCKYTFQVDTYTTMSVVCGDCPFNSTACSNPGCIAGGGISRPVINVNRRVPGPAIYVCENDTIVVDVINNLKTEVLTIHWHGIHQINSSYMDGAPFVTQCPILPSNSFRYKFLAYPHGTHMWHGHVGFQESDGLFGALIIRRNEPTNIKSLYDFDLPEHTLTVWHWYNETNDAVLPPILHRNGSVYGFGLLINNKAALKAFKTKNGTEITMPREKFVVAKGKRYRFRIISNSAIYCPVEISIDSHILNVISSDTTVFNPVAAESLMINAGERFSIIVEANQKEGCYWVRFRGMGDCGPLKSSVHEEAYLCYEGYDEQPNGTTNYYDGRRSGVLVNPMEVFAGGYLNNTLVFLNNLTNLEPELHDYSGTPDEIIYLQLHTRIYDLESPGPWPQFNSISFEFPSQSLLTQRNQLQGSEFCGAVPDESHCLGDFCSCTYIHKVPLHALVEIVMVDISITRFQDHPIHLHGYKFHVVAMDVIGENVTLEGVREMNEQNKITKKLQNATAKDSVSVPNAGYIVVRFIADNPGFWMLHCHVSNHMELGMTMILQVGNYSDMIDTPSDFPTCGHSFYNIEDNSQTNSLGNLDNINLHFIMTIFFIFYCI